jgi:hypothetical protein
MDKHKEAIVSYRAYRVEWRQDDSREGKARGSNRKRNRKRASILRLTLLSRRYPFHNPTLVSLTFMRFLSRME